MAHDHALADVERARINVQRRLKDVIKRVAGAANNVTIDPNGAELIDGAATYTLSALNASAMIQCNGTGWYVLAKV